MAETLTVYGETGSWKSSQLREIAIYLFGLTGKPTRYIAADSTCIPILQDVVEAGIVDLFIIPRRAELTQQVIDPMALIRALQRGCWLPWVPWQNGNQLQQRLMVPNEVLNWQGRLLENDLSKVAAYVVEGFAVIAQHCFIDLVIKGRKIQQDVVGQFTEASYDPTHPEGERFAAAAQAHYSTIQTFILDMVQAFTALPVPLVMFSSHEAKGIDEFSKLSTLGPRIVGKAATTAVLPLLHDYFHLEIAPVAAGPVAAPAAVPAVGPAPVGAIAPTGSLPIMPIGFQAPPMTLERHAYFERHPCTEIPGAYWPAMLRLSHSAMDASGRYNTGAYQHIKNIWPDGYINLSKGGSLVQYLMAKREAQRQVTSGLKMWATGIRQQFESAAAQSPAGAGTQQPQPQPQSQPQLQLQPQSQPLGLPMPKL